LLFFTLKKITLKFLAALRVVCYLKFMGNMMTNLSSVIYGSGIFLNKVIINEFTDAIIKNYQYTLNAKPRKKLELRAPLEPFFLIWQT